MTKDHQPDGEVSQHESILERRWYLYLAAGIIFLISFGLALPVSLYIVYVAHKASVRLTGKELIYRFWTTRKIPFLQIRTIRFPPIYHKLGGTQSTITRDTQNCRLVVHSYSHVATMILMDGEDRVIVRIPFSNFKNSGEWIQRLIHQTGATVHIES